MSLGGSDKKPKVICGESMTKQSFKEETDINQIIAGFAKTGMVSHLNSTQPFYGDVSDMVDYHSALLIVQKADDLFNGMSAEIRSRFDNDPSKMISFLSNSENLDEAVRLGLAVKRPVEPVEGVKSPEGVVTPNVVK